MIRSPDSFINKTLSEKRRTIRYVCIRKSRQVNTLSTQKHMHWILRFCNERSACKQNARERKIVKMATARKYNNNNSIARCT